MSRKNDRNKPRPSVRGKCVVARRPNSCQTQAVEPDQQEDVQREAQDATEEEEPKSRSISTNEALMLFASASAKEVPSKKEERLRGREAFVLESKSEPKPGHKADSATDKASLSTSAARSSESSIALDEADISEQKTVVMTPLGSHQQAKDPEDTIEESVSVDSPKQTKEPTRPSVRGKLTSRNKGRLRTTALSVSSEQSKEKIAGQGDFLKEEAAEFARSNFVSKRKKTFFKSTKSKVGFALILLLLVASLASTAAWMIFNSNVDRAIAVRDNDLQNYLVPAEKSNDPYYVLFVVEYNRTSRYYTGPETIALLRIDPESNIATIIAIPCNTEAPLSDGEYHPISEAEVLGGDAYMVQAVSELLDVNIAHYIRTDDIGLQRIVDQFGGITVDVPEQVSDPDVGDVTIEAGEQTLNGAEAVAFTRADNFSDPVSIQCSNQISAVSVLLDKSVKAVDGNYVRSINELKGDFKTDMTGMQLRRCLMSLVSREGYTTYSVILPGAINEESGGMVYQRDKMQTRILMEAINETGNPEDRDESKIDKISVFIEVQNGTEIVGGASQVRQKLKEYGWNVSFIGNNEDTDTPETLVIYKDDANKEAAEEVVNDLGVGRAVKDEENVYEFGTNILVILGQDWESA